MSVLDAIREHKLRSLKSSISFSENYENGVRAKAEYVKEILKSDDSGSGPEYRMYHLYRKYSGEYTNSFTDVPKVLNNRSLAFWKRVVARQEESGVTPEQYMKAQFAWFHKNFGRMPTNKDLATDNAVIRAKEFNNSTKRIVANSIEAKVNHADLMRQADKQLRDLCKANKMSRKEVYEKLIIPGHFVLPKDFINNDPVYRSIVGER